MKRTMSLTLVFSLLLGASPAGAAGRASSSSGAGSAAIPASGAAAAGALSTGFTGTVIRLSLPETSLSGPAAAPALALPVDPAAAAPAQALQASPAALAKPAEASALVDQAAAKAEISRRINAPASSDFQTSGAENAFQVKDPRSPPRTETYLKLKQLAVSADAFEQGRSLMDGAAALPAAAHAVQAKPARGPHRLRLDAKPAPASAEAPAPASAAPSAKPEFVPWLTFQVVRVLLYLPLRLLYRVRHSGTQYLPKDGPYLIVPNHPSYLDVIFLGLVVGRPIRYLMYRKYYNTFGLRWLFHSFGAIPVAAGEGKDQRDAALGAAKEALARGEIVAIFPEGTVSRTGNLSKFKHGFEAIAEAARVPVVPIHLDGLWGSLFSFRKIWTRPWLRRRIVQVRIGKPLQTVSIQAAREAIQYLGAQSMTERLHMTSETLPRAFVGRAKRYWKRLAVVDSTGRKLTFGRLLTGAVLFAQLLRAALPAATNVGVLLPPSAGGVIANIAVGMTGRVPVNLNYTSSRQAFEHAIADAGIERILTSRRFIEKLEERGMALDKGKFLYLEDMLPLVPEWKRKAVYLLLRVLPKWAIEALYLRDAHRGLTSLAAIVYTSGSSGRPKGVMLTHRNIQANIQMLYRLYSEPGLILGVLPFFHTFGYTVTMWLSLLRGAGSAYHSHPLETQPIAELSDKNHPEMLLGTPSFLSRYTADIPAEAFAYLRTVISGAEKLPAGVAEAFEAKFKTYPLEGYGATELSPVATVNVPDGGDKAHPHVGHRPGTVGQAIPGVALRVVDPETWESVPDGKTGMLIAYGANVMRGYWNRSEETRRVLRGGWYVTGDLAWADREGFIHLAGRAERFSKIFGEKVSHAEVEEALHEAVGASEQRFVVGAAPHPTAGEQLVVLHTDLELDAEALFERMRERGVSRVMTPLRANLFLIDRIPLLGSGKVDYGEVKRRIEEYMRGRTFDEATVPVKPGKKDSSGGSLPLAS